MARRRYRSRSFQWPLGRVDPDRWLRRRRFGIGLLILTIAALAGYDHVRRGPTASQVPARDIRDDLACYDGKTFRVVQTVDGDTVHIDELDKGKPFTIIRLWGVDTPEVHGVKRPAFFGPEASRFTHSVADDQRVRLELVPGRTRDRYGRLLAYIYLPDSRMLNERLVAEGYAYADTRFPHRLRAKFIRLEEQARASKAGLWAGVTVTDMPPWRRKRESPSEASDPRRDGADPPA